MIAAVPMGQDTRRLGDPTHPARGPSEEIRRELRFVLTRLGALIVGVTTLTLGAAAALSAFEDESYWSGVLQAVGIVATVGAREAPSSLGGEITEVVLIVTGVGSLLYLLVTLNEVVVTGHLTRLLSAIRMQRKISELRDHYLVCGYGRVGRRIAAHLKEDGAPFVVIDAGPGAEDAVGEDGVLHIHGDAADDHVLEEARIDSARAVLVCLDDDAQNVFITITARALNPDVEIVARASEEGAATKLERAGANDVVSPYRASGDEMARLALRASAG
jgi:voltage-gated potassium channel